MHRHQRGRGSRGGRGGGGYDKSRRQAFNCVTPGMKGFLCTTNFHEKDSVKEAYNLLNEYYDDHEENKSEGEGPSNRKPVDDGEEDIEAALNEEIEELKDNVHRFKFVDTGVRNVVFIGTTISDPVKLAHKILEDVTSKREQKSRFLIRMIPIETTCRADMDVMVNTAKQLFEKRLKTGCNSYQIIYKARYNSSVNREKVIKFFAEAVAEVNPMNVVNLSDPTFSVMVDIVKNICCLSVVRDYNKFRKYNLIEASTEVDGEKDSSKKNVEESKAPEPAEEMQVDKGTGHDDDKASVEAIDEDQTGSVKSEEPVDSNQ